MYMYKKIAMALVAIGMVMGIAFADEADGTPDSGNNGPAGAILTMTATQNAVTIENIGTAPMDIGGLRLVTKVGNVGTVVGEVPYGTILRPEPFIFTKGLQGNDYKITVEITPLNVWDIVYLTNGVGNYVTAIVQ